MAKVTTTVDERGDVEALLQQLPADLQFQEFPKALRAGTKPIVSKAKQNVRNPGYPGDDPSKTPLKNTIKAVIRRYEYITIAIVGTSWPEGAHGWLVEFGHNITRTKGGDVIGQAQPHPFMRNAIDATKSETDAAIVQKLQLAISQYHVT